MIERTNLNLPWIPFKLLHTYRHAHIILLSIYKILLSVEKKNQTFNYNDKIVKIPNIKSKNDIRMRFKIIGFRQNLLFCRNIIPSVITFLYIQ